MVRQHAVLRRVRSAKPTHRQQRHPARQRRKLVGRGHRDERLDDHAAKLAAKGRFHARGVLRVGLHQIGQRRNHARKAITRFAALEHRAGRVAQAHAIGRHFCKRRAATFLAHHTLIQLGNALGECSPIRTERLGRLPHALELALCSFVLGLDLLDAFGRCGALRLERGQFFARCGDATLDLLDLLPHRIDPPLIGVDRRDQLRPLALDVRCPAATLARLGTRLRERFEIARAAVLGLGKLALGCCERFGERPDGSRFALDLVGEPGEPVVQVLEPFLIRLAPPVRIFERTLRHADALFSALPRVLGRGALVLERSHAALGLDRLALCGELGIFCVAKPSLGLAALARHCRELAGQSVEPLPKLVVLVEHEREAVGGQLIVEQLELASLLSLPSHDSQASLGVVQLRARALEVALGPLELALGFNAALAVFGDARRLFEDDPSFLRRGEQHAVDLALLDDRVRIGADARVHEQLADIAHPRTLAVDEVRALAVAVELPLDLDLVGLDRKHPASTRRTRALRRGVGHEPGVMFGLVSIIEFDLNGLGVRVDDRVLETQRHACHAGRRSSGRAREDHVDHFFAAEALARALAEHPLDRIDDVALAAAVGPDDAGHSVVEVELRPIGKRLESLHRELRKPHRVPDLPVRAQPNNAGPAHPAPNDAEHITTFLLRQSATTQSHP